jgi:ribosomal protein S18 acetylase RimI-like enzyme
MGRMLAMLKRPMVIAIEQVQGLVIYRAAAARFRPIVRISEASETDVQAARAWFNPGSHDRPQPHAPGVTNYVAQRRGKIVGFVQLVRRGEDAGPHSGYWLYSLRVRLPYRGMGLGETLCQQVIEQAQKEGAPELALMVVENNDAATTLYGKLGFARKPVPALDAQMEQEARKSGRKRIVMSKCLALPSQPCAEESQ